MSISTRTRSLNWISSDLIFIWWKVFLEKIYWKNFNLFHVGKFGKFLVIFRVQVKFSHRFWVFKEIYQVYLHMNSLSHFISLKSLQFSQLPHLLILTLSISGSLPILWENFRKIPPSHPSSNEKFTRSSSCLVLTRLSKFNQILSHIELWIMLQWGKCCTTSWWHESIQNENLLQRITSKINW